MALELGAVALAFVAPRNALVATRAAVAGLVVIVATALVAPAVPEYAAPVSPAFLALAAAGVLGVPVRTRASRRRWRPGAALAGLAVGCRRGVWAVRSTSQRRSTSSTAPVRRTTSTSSCARPGEVLHGDSPYVYDADQTFAYPPFLAFLVAPLHPLERLRRRIPLDPALARRSSRARCGCSELRDWRCYALAFVYPVTRSAFELGTIGPLLLLAVAAAWRWRDRLVAAGAAPALRSRSSSSSGRSRSGSRSRAAYARRCAAVGVRCRARIRSAGRRSASPGSATIPAFSGASPTTRRRRRTRSSHSACARTCRRLRHRVSPCSCARRCSPRPPGSRATSAARRATATSRR